MGLVTSRQTVKIALAIDKMRGQAFSVCPQALARFGVERDQLPGIEGKYLALFRDRMSPSKVFLHVVIVIHLNRPDRFRFGGRRFSQEKVTVKPV